MYLLPIYLSAGSPGLLHAQRVLRKELVALALNNSMQVPKLGRYSRGIAKEMQGDATASGNKLEGQQQAELDSRGQNCENIGIYKQSHHGIYTI